jgi:hypothetical protein
MKTIKHDDNCSVGSAVDDVKVSVTFRGAHTGSFEVILNGDPRPPNDDGTVSLGRAFTLPGASVLVKTLVHQIGPGTFFETDYVLQGIMCGPFTVQDSFDVDDPDAKVLETIKFK